MLEKPLQIVVVGRKEDPAFQSLLGAVHKVSLANRVLLSLLGLAHIDVDVRVVLRWGLPDALEFPHPDADFRDPVVVPEL